MLKTLNTCTPREFIRQMGRITKAARAWMDLTKLHDLRRRLPPAVDGQSDADRRAAMIAQWRANIRDMIDTALLEHPDETIELLGLLCFIEPEDLDKHAMSELYTAVLDMLRNDDLLDTIMLALGTVTRINAESMATRGMEVLPT